MIIFKRSIKESRRAVFGWTLGIASLVWMEFAVYPTVRNQPDFAKLVENYPKELKAFFGLSDQLDFHSAKGFISTELFSFMLPLMFILAGVFIAAKALATEEDRQTLGILLSQPVSRSRVAAEKAFGVVAAILAIALLTSVSLVLANVAFSTKISLPTFAGAMTTTIAIAFWAAAWSFTIGAMTGKHGFALAVGAIVAIASYVIDSLSKIVTELKGLNHLSIYHYANPVDAFKSPVSYIPVLIFVILSCLLVVVGTWAFKRRDIR